jgi:phosphoglycerate dehydrogenase-like enzyme
VRRVVYTDPTWAIDPMSGELELGIETLEQEILGDDTELVLGIRRNGSFVVEGPAFHETLDGADAVVVYRARVDDGLLAAVGSGCRVIARQGAGIDNLDLASLRSRAIFSFHVPDYCIDEVAIHTLALAMALERGVCMQDRMVKEDRWNTFAGGIPRRLSELTLGIVGFGRIGRATASRARALFETVICYDPYVPADVAASYGANCCRSLEEVVAESDVIVLHAELNEKNRGMIDAAALAHARPGAMLVNTARGALVDSAAVLEALRDDLLGGYASDVFVPEDPNRDPTNSSLLEHPKVIASSHRAFLSETSNIALRRRVAVEVAHVLETGEPPRNGRLT